ncbi:AAA family ATPase [Deinococcus aquaedulcis]|uniref:AAA family ATPase n=1 Tax=Deinococcus aquaedulcis TaxID=2840455 RepID=UPI001C828332|nr:AAA family ATPase [Deinococcus aquaedulcis]
MAKILITGTFSAGKTTLFNDLIKELNLSGTKYTYLSDTARECPFPLNSSQTIDTSNWLFGKQVERESLVTNSFGDGLIICDRGTPDIAGHTMSLNLTGSKYEVIIACLSEWTKTYDLIFFAERNKHIAIRADGVREINTELQALVEKHITEFLASFPNTVRLPQETSDRKQTILQHLRVAGLL